MEPAITAAGHDGATSGEGVFVKPTNSTELDFYSQMVERQSPLLDVCPVYMGKLEPQGEPQNNPENKSLGKPCVVLGDVLWGFKEPNIMDIKIGSVLWDKHAAPEKVARLKAVSDSTTSGSMGFRIAGITVMENGKRHDYGKMYGRQGVDASNITEKLLAFFPERNEYTEAVKEAMAQQLDYLVQIVCKEPVEMHSASVLFVYEGNADALKERVDAQHEPDPKSDQESDSEGGSDSEREPKPILAVKLIDFGHATYTNEPYDDHVRGLKQLQKVWSMLDF